MDQEEKKVVIVGASAAGLRCAARLRRLEPGWSIVVVEQSPVFSVAACGMPYVLSGDISDSSALLKTGDGVVRDADYFSRVKGVEVLVGHRAVGVDPEGKTLTVSGPDSDRQLPWDELVLATGARPRALPGQPEHPRVHSFHVFADLLTLDAGLKKGQIESVIIVGAGLVGCELAEAFKSLWDAEVTLVEAEDWPLPQVLDRETGAIVARELTNNEVVLRCGVRVEEIEADDGGATVFANGERFEADAVVVALGLQPAVELATSAGLSLGPTGAIAVNDRLATSQDHIWAVGDCTEVRHVVSDAPAHRPLGSLANRQGRTLANILAGRPDRFPAVAGAAAIKVFDLNVACTGLPLAEARRTFEHTQVVWTSPHDRAHYWPEASNIYLLLVFDAESRRVLGVQAVGPGECAKRIDVATGLLARKAGLSEFIHLEHAYAPAYAPAMEPLAQAAMVAENALDGLIPRAPGSDLERAGVLDVRHDFEIEEHPLSGESVKIVDQVEVRSKLGELGRGPWTVVCARGVRSAETARLLQSEGISADYLAGGLAWLMASGALTKPGGD